MGEYINRLRREAANSSSGAEAYLDYLIDLLKNAITRTVPASQGYQIIVIPDDRFLAEIAYLKSEDGVDIDDAGLPEHERDYQQEELAALKIPI